MASFTELVKDSTQFYKIINDYITAKNKATLDHQKNYFKDHLRHYLLSRQQVNIVPGEYEREHLLVDVVHEAICHGVNKGLNVSDISAMVVTVLEGTYLLKEDCIETINNKMSQLLYKLSGSFTTLYGLQITAQYIAETLIQHYHLYNLLMTYEQEREINQDVLSISVPPNNSFSLEEAIIEEEWERKERLGVVETEYNNTLNKLKLERESLLKEEKEKMDVLYKSLNDSLEESEQQVDQEELKSVMDPLIQSHVTETQTELLHRLKEEESHFSYCIDKIVAIKGKPVSPVKEGINNET